MGGYDSALLTSREVGLCRSDHQDIALHVLIGKVFQLGMKHGMAKCSNARSALCDI